MQADDPQQRRGFISALFRELGSVVRQSFADSWLMRIVLAITAALALCYLWTSWLHNVLITNGFGPHGDCLLWLPGLITLYVGSDSLIGLAYISISATLIYLVYAARRSIPFQWVFVAFGIFIVTCGATHFLDILTLWVPVYWLLGLVKLLTALASVTTAVTLPPLVPKVLDLIDLERVSAERKRQLEQAHRELERLYEKSQELDRLKTTFFANVSHELRTPLTLILGPTKTLLATPQMTEQQQQMLEVVQLNALTLLKQVNDLLTIAQLETGHLTLHITKVDLAQLLQMCTDHFASLAQERQLTFQVESPASVLAYLDADKIQRVCLNLLSNALKFTPPGGRVHCVLSQQGERGLIMVQDSGPGIKPDLRHAIFERFRQGEESQTRRFGGTGLGLAIVKELVELHEGTVTVDDAPEGGACFTVNLPLGTSASTHFPPMQPTSSPGEELITPYLADLTLASSNEANQEAEHQSKSAKEQPLVLIIEDHRDMARFLAEILAPAYRVVLAGDGLEGLEKALHLQPDLLLCDIMMPHMSGEQFVQQVRRHRTLDAIPIMILSARADDGLRVQLLHEGVQEYLVKPFFPEELRARVTNLIAMKQTRQVLQQEVATQNQSLVLLATEVAQRKRESQQALEALQQANEHLAYASQVQRNFVAVVSHEFRTALTSIQGFSELMCIEAFSPQEIKEYATDIHVQAKRLSRMIADLLDLERMKSGHMPFNRERVDLNNLIREVIEHVRPTASGHQFDLHLDDAQPACLGDRDKLTQVIINLISNAIKYSPRGGAIQVRSQVEQQMAQVWVQDEGVGIAPEALQEIFDPYCRIEAGTTRYIKGTGLGLSIARQIIQIHGGQIWVESSLGQGARFSFTLPLTDQEQEYASTS